MRTDPRAACANASERLGWAVLHDLLAHPLMALTNWARWALAFHDWTSVRAWPRPATQELWTAEVPSCYGLLHASELAPGIWRVQHPRVNHSVTVQASGLLPACLAAVEWFDSLSSEFGGAFSARPAPGGDA